MPEALLFGERGKFDGTEEAGAEKTENCVGCRGSRLCGLSLRAKGKEWRGSWEYGGKGVELRLMAPSLYFLR